MAAEIQHLQKTNTGCCPKKTVNTISLLPFERHNSQTKFKALLITTYGQFNLKQPYCFSIFKYTCVCTPLALCIFTMLPCINITLSTFVPLMLTQIILHIYHSNGHSETGNIHLMVQMDVCAHVHQREREMDRKMHRQMIMGSRIKFISHPQQPQSFISFTDAEKTHKYFIQTLQFNATDQNP